MFAALYRTLHGLALACLRGELPGRTLGATALVHEAYLRFRKAQNLSIADRKHFLALTARVMRHILVDKARSRRAQPELLHAEDPCESLVRTDTEADEIIAVDRALMDLALQSPRQSEIVELLYFGGHSAEECAMLLGVSEKTVRRDWQVARVRLRIAINGTPS